MAVFDLEDRADLKPRKGLGAHKDRHRKALDGFKASASYFTEQRKREVEDLKFVDFDEQWDPTVKTQRAGNQAVNGLPPTPPRPTLTINQLRAPCQQVANARRQARLELEFAPKGGGATQDVAEVFEDIVRAAQAESRAAIARNWGADRAEKAGMGWYRIDTDYCEESDDPAAFNDQDLVWRRILNQASVFPDPHAQEPDFSDGRRLYVTEDLPLDRYRDEYPESDLAAYDNSELAAIGNELPKWIFTSANGVDGDESQTIRIAECWEVVESERTRVLLKDGRKAYTDELDDDTLIDTEKPRRAVRDRKIFWSKMNAVEYLEPPREVNGRYIPIVPCIGNESNVNGERRWTGIVRPGRDAAVSYNVMRSAQVEAIATASKAPYIGFARVIGQYMEWWKQSAIRNFPILPVEEAYDKQGGLLPIPIRNPAQTDIGAMTLAAGAAKDDVHITTGVPPVALGQLDPHDRSGKAIQALQGQSEVGSSGYLDNFVTITLAYEGKVVRDLIPRLFDRPGRVVPAIGLDEKRRLVMLNHPYLYLPDGTPQMLPGWKEGMPVPKELPGPDGQPIEVHYINLAKGQYGVAPVAGKAANTRREEAAAAIGNAVEALKGTPMGMAIIPAWLEEQDWPGAKKVAAIAKNALPPELRAAYQDGQGQLPPEVQAQMQAMQQQLQQMQQMIETKQVEQQGKLQQVQMQEQAETQRAALDRQTQIDKAVIAADSAIAVAEVKTANADLDRRLKLLELFLTSEKEHRLESEAREHDTRSQARDHAADIAGKLLDHQHATAQAEQAAALTPAPTETGA